MKDLPSCFVVTAGAFVLLTFVAWLLTGCGGASKPPCTPESVAALRTLYSHAARDVIEAGSCDEYEHVERCPAYLTLEKHFELTSRAMCGGG